MLPQSTIGVPEGFDAQEKEARRCAGPAYSLCPPHLMEREVVRTLHEAPGVHVESLSAHRTDDGVCLHGVVEIDDPSTDVEAILRNALAIDHVINRMVVKHGHGIASDSAESGDGFMWG